MGEIKQGEQEDSDGGVSRCWGKASEVKEWAWASWEGCCERRNSKCKGCLNNTPYGCSHAASRKRGRKCEGEMSRAQIMEGFCNAQWGALILSEMESAGGFGRGEMWPGFKGGSWETGSWVRGRCWRAVLGECKDGRFGALQNMFYLHKLNLDTEISFEKLSIWRSVSQSRPRILAVMSELILGAMAQGWAFYILIST